MLKVGINDTNIIGKVIQSLQAEATGDGGLNRIVGQGSVQGFLALESADEATRSSINTGFKVTRQALSALLGKHYKLALEDADGETIEGNDEAGVEDGREAMLTQAQLQAGAITAAALDDPAAYAKLATKVKPYSSVSEFIS